jgi:gamma-glutamyltranspeptidase/glutathione hydrolase
MYRTLFVALSFVLGSTGFALPKNGPVQSRSVTFAKNQMVATSHPKATIIALDVLRAGGTAVDAAIAANAYLGFIEPTMAGIGGDLYAIVWNESNPNFAKGLHGLNASGRSQLALTSDMVRQKYGPETKVIPMTKPESWSVPGAVDGWFKLHSRFGKLPMKTLLQPAIDAAESGEPVPGIIAHDWQFPGWFAAIQNNPGFAQTFLTGGKAPLEGEVFKNPALAKTYRTLATKGRDAFYRGEITNEIIAFSNVNGGYFSWKDFDRNDHAEWVKPLSTDYRGVTVWQLPPNGQGLAVLQMLNILKTYDFKALGWNAGNTDYWHTMLETKKLVYESMARYYADPDRANVPVDVLLSQEFAMKLKAQIKPNASVIADLNIPEIPRLEAGDTTYITVADKYGNMVSLIESHYFPFGSGYVVSGFPIQNRGALFSLDKKSPNHLEPNKRPFHTIIPAFVTKNGKPWISFGYIGGAVQPQGQVQFLVNVLDFGMNIQEAIDSPKIIHSLSSGPEGTVAVGKGTVFVEEHAPEAVRTGLAARGHDFFQPGDKYILRYLGGGQAILKDQVTGVLSGASDSRKDGMAAGY